MDKIDELLQAARALTADQLDALLHLVATMRGQAMYYSAPDDVLALLDRSLSEIEAGAAVDGEAVFRRIDQRLKVLGA